MAAAVIDRYGGPEVLHLGRVPKPGLKPDQVLVRVRAASVNPIDCGFRKGQMGMMAGRKFPKTVGLDFCGDVEEVGAQVTEFKPGDAVYSFLSPMGTPGSFAEYVAVPAKQLAKKPANLSYTDTAAMPVAASTAFKGLVGKGQLRAGQKLLVVGASGGVGTFAVQIGKILGAHVTGVCSGRNADLVKGLGADQVIDYTSTDFTKQDVRYDVIFDAATASFSASRVALQRGGHYVTIVFKPSVLFDGLVSRLTGPGTCHTLMAFPKADELRQLAAWAEAGQLRPVVEKVYPLAEAGEAHKASETGRSRGKLVVSIDGAKA
jgi:NADPH:quinone reductase-like Zn-dependent oxidoreductase